MRFRPALLLILLSLPQLSGFLGVAVLSETVDATFGAGGVLIVAGIWVVNRRG